MEILLRKPRKPIAPISPVIARLGLRSWGIGRAEIAALFAGITDTAAREAAEDAWEYATEIRRDDPFIALCALSLGKTDREVDALFT